MGRVRVRQTGRHGTASVAVAGVAAPSRAARQPRREGAAAAVSAVAAPSRAERKFIRDPFLADAMEAYQRNLENLAQASAEDSVERCAYIACEQSRGITMCVWPLSPSMRAIIQDAHRLFKKLLDVLATKKLNSSAKKYKEHVEDRERVFLKFLTEKHRGRK